MQHIITNFITEAQKRKMNSNTIERSLYRSLEMVDNADEKTTKCKVIVGVVVLTILIVGYMTLINWFTTGGHLKVQEIGGLKAE
jgi:ABC-type antimicrobial peptide transport system permease subunit